MAEGAEVFFEDHKESRDLGRLALRGGAASVAMQYANGALRIIAAVVLARLLAPEDFGLVAIITALTSFAPLLIDFGLGDATTQKQKITPSQVSTLFWLSSGIGLLIGVVVAAFCPLIARIFGEPRLQAIAAIYAVTFVLFGMSNQHLAFLRRTMQFGKIAKIQIISTLLGTIIAVLIAANGYGYWALVLRPIVTTLGVAIGAWFLCGWRPGFPVVDGEVKSMIRFGLHVVSFSVVYTLGRAIDRVALGLFYRPGDVGYYQNATTLYDNSIFSVLNQLHTVGSAALSRLQANPAALRQKYEAALSTVAFFVMPMATILSVTAQDLTVLLLGEKWRFAGLLLSIIALRGIFQVVEGSQGWLHLSTGTADRWRNWGIVTTIVQVVTVLIGLPFGPVGVAIASVATILLVAIPSICYAGRPIGIGAALAIRAVGPQMIGAIGSAVGGWCLQITALADYSSVVRILLSTGVCVSIYLFIVIGLFRLTEPINVAAKAVQWAFGLTQNRQRQARASM
jgi:O-antigen/teichoic acid export membrane protein